MMASKVGFLLAGLAVAAFAVSAKRSPTYERIWRRSTDWISSTPRNRDSSEVEDVGDMVRRVIFGGPIGARCDSHDRKLDRTGVVVPQFAGTGASVSAATGAAR
jgi:hypothetical protein